MNEDDLLSTKSAKPVDLDVFSIEELEERISRLKEEILRCEAKIISKKASMDAANALFGNHKK